MTELFVRDLVTRRGASGLLVAGLAAVATPVLAAAKASEITQDARTALNRLYADNAKARAIGGKSRAILVFPEIVKAGLMVGGQVGDGAMFIGGRVSGFYRIAAGSCGLQIGAQKYAYAMFFMTQSAIDYMKKSKGWAVGSGPSYVALDEGKAQNNNSSTLQSDIYGVAFGQKGLMAGLGLEGSKITEIHPDK